ncbi:MAG: STAS domain-containing protein [Coriobacteriia bacterium]|nr:STAS domain-containing protein [Coriobacteriia bacterium]
MQIQLSGNIDSGNASEVDKYIEAKIADKTPNCLIIDFEKVDHITSAGLRVFLKYEKKIGDIRIINVSQSVYTIFENIGFTAIMSVESPSVD